LRVIRLAICQSPDEELDDGDDDHGGRRFDQSLEVFGQTAVASEPAEGSFDHPTSWDDLEALGMQRPFDDLEPKPGASGMVCGDRALIAGVRKEAHQPGELPLDPFAGLGQAVTVLDARGMNREVQWQADRISNQMTLAPIDFLASVIATQTARFRGFHALTVNHTRRRRGLPAGSLAYLHQEDHPDTMPDAVVPKAPEIAVDRALRRKLLWQHVPGTAGADQIEDRVQHLA